MENVEKPGLTQNAKQDAWLRVVLENALDAVVGMDCHGVIVDWNRQAEEIFGWSKTQAVGRSLAMTVIPPEFREAHTRGIRHFLQSGVGPILNHRVELEAMHRRGSRFPVELTVIPVTVDGRYRFYSFIRDISEKRKAEKDLQLKSEAIENSLNAFDIVDSEGKLIYVNRAYLKMWGYETPDEVIGTSPSHHCADPTTPQTIIKVLKERGECDIEFIAKRKNGTFFDVRMWARLTHDSNGKEIYPTTAVDITERKQSRERAELERVKFETIFEKSPAIMALMSGPNFVFEKINEACQILIGQREVNGKSLLEALPEMKDQPFPEILRRVYETGEPHIARESKVYLQRVPNAPLEEAYLDQTYQRINGPRGEPYGVLATAVEVTTQVRARKSVESLADELRSAVKARDEFISICSHELKTPITSMKLQFDMAARQIEKGDPRAFSHETVERRVIASRRQLDRMSSLIEDMLDVSRISANRLEVKREPLDLFDLIRETIERFSQQFAILGVDVSFEGVPDGIIVLGDGVRIEQVLSNLLTNAIKYGAGNPIRISLQTIGENAQIRVKDQGLGIEQENLDRIFGRFERAIPYANISGLGLGLYICRQIVEALHGRIWAESTPGQGSTFIVELPLAKLYSSVSKKL